MDYKTGDPTITENNDLSATAEVQESHDHVIDATMEATDAVRACDSSDPQLIELPFNSAKVGIWVKVVYEEESFLGKITDLCIENGCEVRFLKFSCSEVKRSKSKFKIFGLDAFRLILNGENP